MKKTENQDTLDEFEMLANMLPQIVFETNIEGYFTFVNEYGINTFGYSKEQVAQGLNISDVLTPEDKERVKQNFDSIISGEEGNNHQYDALTKDGERFPVLIYSKAIHESGQTVGLRGFVVDYSEQALIKKELMEREEKLRALFNTMDEIILEIDKDGYYLYIAPTSPELLVKPSNKLLGKRLDEVFPPDEAEKFLTFIRKSLNENKTISMEYSVKLENRDVWFLGKATPKTANSVLFVAHDITKQKDTEAALIKHREHLEDIVTKRTQKLEEQKLDLENMNRLFVGREFRIKELRDEVKKLKENNKIGGSS